MTTCQPIRQKAKSQRVRGLDSIRFLCALWVAFSHGAYPPLTSGHDPSNSIAWFVNGCYTTLFCGPAAVIIFFVISGFCIHYPYREKWSKAYLIPFLLSRAIRIMGPIGVIMIINIATGRSNLSFYNLIGWSIVCELFYYSIYPFIRGFINTQQGWRVLFIVSLTPTLLAPFLFEIHGKLSWSRTFIHSLSRASMLAMRSSNCRKNRSKKRLTGKTIYPPYRCSIFLFFDSFPSSTRNYWTPLHTKFLLNSCHVLA